VRSQWISAFLRNENTPVSGRLAVVESTRTGTNDNPLSEIKIRYAFIARRTVGTGID
jgi:hypothetical protein